MTPQADLIERLRTLLAADPLAPAAPAAPSIREVSMFGGRSFMVNEKLVVSALKAGNLLVRVDAARHGQLLRQPGAHQAEMGAGRDMGPGWIEVAAASITDDERLSFWLNAALDHNRTVVSGKPH